MTLPAASKSRLAEMENRFGEIERALADPATANDPNELKKLGQEHSELRPVIESWRIYSQAEADLEEAKTMLQGANRDERTYLDEEIATQKETLDRLSEELMDALAPKDPNDDRNVIIEIRAGAGGDEAALFAAEIFRMYQRFAERMRWKTDVLNSDPTGIQGVKEVSLEIKGKGAWSWLKYEGGVHRVQRVPATESSGRIHTSTVPVIVLPEAEEVDVQIDPNDLRIDVYRSSGPGGQSVNTTDSAVRITHLPTGEVVSCQDEKSQLQNKEKAMRILRSRLLQVAQEEQAKAASDERRSQVRTGDRSEKIRTYNWHDNRVTDHRIHFTSHRLGEILDGDLKELIEALRAHDRMELQQVGS
jgi:peptide chain release factor 1